MLKNFQSDAILKVMHSLGFAHEHQRPDRNNFVNVYRTKMTSNCFEAFDIIPMDPTKRKSDSKYQVAIPKNHAALPRIFLQAK